jgi:hypothetical protein
MVDKKMDTKIKYKELTIHQKISLKSMIKDKQGIECFSHRDNEVKEMFSQLSIIYLLWGFRVAIQFFLSGNTDDIPHDY